MSKRRWIALISLLATAGIGAGIVTFALSKETGARHEWKVAAIADIERIFADQSATTTLLDPIRQEVNKPKPKYNGWFTSDAAIMADGQWIIFQNRYTHRYPEIGDIWIGKASNGRWYYSTYHFCSNMIALEMESQPSTLEEFCTTYFVRPFDGKADYALEPTWNSSGAAR